MRIRSYLWVVVSLLAGVAVIVAGFFFVLRSRLAASLPAATVAGGKADAGGSPAPAAERTSNAGADRATNKAVEAVALEGKASPVSVGTDVALKLELEKRRRTVSALAAYSDRAAALKEKIRAEEGAITRDKVPTLVTRAQRCETRFWKDGDFDKAGSFDAIYEARAALELCLEADPNDEQSLREMFEVLQAGWPIILDADVHRQFYLSSDPVEKAVALRNSEGLDAEGPVGWRLWQEDISKRSSVTIDDLSVALSVLQLAPAKEFFTSADAETRKNNPNATRAELAKGRIAAEVKLKIEVLDWATNACRKNPDWQVFCSDLEATRARLVKETYAVPSLNVLAPKPADLRNMRYWGRSGCFLGPESRRNGLVSMAPFLREWSAAKK